MNTITADKIRAHFKTRIAIREGSVDERIIALATVGELKSLLHGQVYQNQTRFCEQMDCLGFAMSYCHPFQAWVVHDRPPTTGHIRGRVL